MGTGPEAGLGTLPTRRPRAHSFGLDLDRQPMSRVHFRFRTPQPRDGPSKSAAAAGEPVERLPRCRAPLSAAVSPPALLCVSTPGCRQRARLPRPPASSPLPLVQGRMPCPSSRPSHPVSADLTHRPGRTPCRPSRLRRGARLPCPGLCVCCTGILQLVQRGSALRGPRPCFLRGTRCHRLGRLLLGIKEKMSWNRQHTIDA